MMILNYLTFCVLIFLDLIKILIIVEIILSWLQLVGLVVKIQFIENITKPIYDYIKKYIPTTFGPIDFTPIVVIILLQVTYAFIVMLNPGVIILLP